jgi:hypothetical protein
MAIGTGIPNPEEWLGYSTVADIDLSHAKIKRNREVTGLVLVHDYQDQPAPDAAVTVKWFLPDGSMQIDQAVTSRDGVATFQLSGRLDRGTYTFIIDDVELADHIWNYTGGVTSAKLYVK